MFLTICLVPLISSPFLVFSNVNSSTTFHPAEKNTATLAMNDECTGNQQLRKNPYF